MEEERLHKECQNKLAQWFLEHFFSPEIGPHLEPLINWERSARMLPLKKSRELLATIEGSKRAAPQRKRRRTDTVKDFLRRLAGDLAEDLSPFARLYMESPIAKEREDLEKDFQEHLLLAKNQGFFSPSACVLLGRDLYLLREAFRQSLPIGQRRSGLMENFYIEIAQLGQGDLEKQTVLRQIAIYKTYGQYPLFHYVRESMTAMYDWSRVVRLYLESNEEVRRFWSSLPKKDSQQPIFIE